jgi:hypothetical protein
MASIVNLMLFIVILGPVSILFFRYAIKRAKKAGSRIQYQGNGRGWGAGKAIVIKGLCNTDVLGRIGLIIIIKAGQYVVMFIAWEAALLKIKTGQHCSDRRESITYEKFGFIQHV